MERRQYSVRGIANYILDYADDVGVKHTNMGINKLTFFVVESVLVHRGVLLTDAKIEAWEHGPVFRELYQSFKSYGNGLILGRAQYFSADRRQFEISNACIQAADDCYIREILAPLVRLTAAELRALSHREAGAWHQVWWYQGRANPGMEISPTLLLDAYDGSRL